MSGSSLGKRLKKKLDYTRGTDIIEEMKPSLKESVMFNQTRISMFEMVTRLPGMSTSEISKRMGISDSTVKWHMHKLEEGLYVTSVRTGKKRAYFAVEQLEPEDEGLFHTINQQGTIRAVFVSIIHTPGVTISELSRKLEVSYQAIRWSVGILTRSGLVESVKEGRNARLYITDMWQDRAKAYNRASFFRRYILKRFKDEHLNPEVLPSRDNKLVVLLTAGGERRECIIHLNPFVLEDADLIIPNKKRV